MPTNNTTTDDDSTVTEKVERTDTGYSLTAEIKRGSGTRDQDKLTAKVKEEDYATAREQMDQAIEDMEEWAEHTRQIQPDAGGDE